MLLIAQDVFLRPVTKPDLATLESFLAFIKKQPELATRQKLRPWAPISYGANRSIDRGECLFVGISTDEDFQLAMQGAAGTEAYTYENYGKVSSDASKFSTMIVKVNF